MFFMSCLFILQRSDDAILERWDGVMWTGLVWLMIGTGGELVNLVLNLQVP
jgi:hypothetical protein